MASNSRLSKGLDSDIRAVHLRFTAAMESRLPAMSVDTKERYFGVVSALVSKLEDAGKPLRQVLQEIMAEAAGMLFQELGSGGGG